MLNESSEGLAECMCSDRAPSAYGEAYARYNMTLVIVLLPLLSVFGLATNLLSLVVYTRPHLRASSFVYLAALSGSDLFLVLTGMCLFWMDSARAYFGWLEKSPFLTVHSLPIGYMAQTTSVYVTVWAALDCYLGLEPSSRAARVWCRRRRAVEMVLGTVAGSVAYNAIRFGFYSLRRCVPGPGAATTYEICPTELCMRTFAVYSVYLYSVFVVALPFSLLLGLVALILHSLRSAPGGGGGRAAAVEVRPGSVLKASVLPPPSSGGGEQKTTLILVICLFLACNTLALFINFFEAFFQPQARLLNFLTDASNFLVILNSSVNFFIYMAFSAAYRRTVLRWAKRLWPLSAKRPKEEPMTKSSTKPSLVLTALDGSSRAFHPRPSLPSNFSPVLSLFIDDDV